MMVWQYTGVSAIVDFMGLRWLRNAIKRWRKRKEYIAANVTPLEMQKEKLNQEARQIQDNIESLKTLRNSFARNFGKELKKKKYEIDGLYEELNSIKSKLKKRYDDLEDTKSALDAWYAESDGLFLGNHGRKLEKHSWFNQDLNDRDELKDERDALGEEIGELKSERDEIYDAIQQKKAERKEIYKIRDELGKFRSKGKTAKDVDMLIAAKQASLEPLEKGIVDLEEEIRKKLKNMPRF